MVRPVPLLQEGDRFSTPRRATNGGTTLTTTQTFARVDDLLTQLVNARVWIGFHFRNSVVTGEHLGTAVANWELERYFLPTDEQDG